MRHPIGFFALFLAQPARRTISCSHCGDRFIGDPADGRAWLREHSASDHIGPVRRAEPRPGRALPALQPLPATTFSTTTSRT
jgi:hypothetical protein